MKRNLQITHKASAPTNGERTYEFIEENAPRKLTIEQIKRHKEFENISEEEVIQIIETLYKLSILAYFFYLEENRKSLDIAA